MKKKHNYRRALKTLRKHNRSKQDKTTREMIRTLRDLRKMRRADVRPIVSAATKVKFKAKISTLKTQLREEKRKYRALVKSTKKFFSLFRKAGWKL